MPRLTIDGRTVDAPDGMTVMDAAALAGIEIPGLCQAPGLPPITSCMLCSVKDRRTGRTLMACATEAGEGMDIETRNDALDAARKEILQLILSEHAGDCEAPCRRICPASLDVPLMMRMTAAGDAEGAARLAKEALILPATLGWVCSAPCERGCHRGAIDEPLLIKELHRRLAEQALANESPAPQLPAPTGKRVAIAGGGVAGLAAACALARLGHACTLFEREDRAGGALRELDEDELPGHILDAEIGAIVQLGVELRTNACVGTNIPLQEVLDKFDAVLIACEDDALEDADDEEHVFTALELPMTVNAVGEGKEMAAEIDRFLRGIDGPPPKKAFDCRLVEIRDTEKEAFTAHRMEPATRGQGRLPHDSQAEARRCLHCDCHKPVSCKLRRYATEYGAVQFGYHEVERPPVEACQVTDTVWFEPGKCIRCGLCVEITARQGEPVGMAFVDRGFDTRVMPPLGRSLTKALTVSARACVEACPTAALSWRNNEERHP
jgi:ferredoxin